MVLVCLWKSGRISSRLHIDMELHALTKNGLVTLAGTAVQQMSTYGLAPFHLLDTLEYGCEVGSPVMGLHQFVGCFDGTTQVHVLAAQTLKHTTSLAVATVKVLMCWVSPLDSQAQQLS